MMEKIDKGHSLSQSTDFVAQNIETLKSLFPTILKEGKIDIKELQALLSDEVESEDEYYRFTWAGKSMARGEANKPSTATLRPDKESSKDWDTTQNIFIEGDNLEVLKLLQKSYANKIKMIYIDPPYNTGNDFVYKDNYNDNLGNYLSITGQVDDEGKRINTNSESDGRYHSNWLNMMYPRLKLARNLLKEDGAIFISIGVEELDNLKKVCNEVFGEDNFIEVFSWVKTSTPPALSTKSRKTNEYILCYEKGKNPIKYKGEALDGGDQPLLNSGNSIGQLKFPKESVQFNTKNFTDGLLKAGKKDRVSLLNDLQIKNGYADKDIILEGEFKWTQDFLNEELQKGTKFIIKTTNLSIRFIRDEEGFKRPTNFIKDKIISPLINKPENGVGTNENASSELSTLIGKDIFDFPKPVSLIKYLIGFIVENENDLVLDFFAGSGTTAHAVMELNSLDAGSRRFICVQLPEKTEDKSEAYKAGYKTISRITLKRIIKAGELLQTVKNNDLFTEEGKTLDIGFRAFKLDSSNIRAWDGYPDTLEDNLFNAGSNIKENRTEEDVLYEILLKYGLDLTMPIEQKAIAGIQVFNIGIGALFICLGDNITTAVAEGIGKWKEELQPATSKVIFKDTGFTDVEKTNSMQILKRYGILEVNTI
jgi:adenine-specific DNA-methyltransferase